MISLNQSQLSRKKDQSQQVKILKMHLTNELFQQYAEALEKQNNAKDKQNTILHSQLKTVLQENSSLRDKLNYQSSKINTCSTTYNSNSQIKNGNQNNVASGNTTPIKKVMAKMAQSQLIYDPTPKKMKTQESLNQDYKNRHSFLVKNNKNNSMIKTQAIYTQGDYQDVSPLQMQEILSFIERVQYQTQYISEKYHSVKNQRNSCLAKIKKLQKANNNLQKMLNSQLKARNELNENNKQNENCKNVRRSTDRCCYRRVHQITGEDIISFKPKDLNKLFIKQKRKDNFYLPKNTINSNKIKTNQKQIKEQFKKNQRIFINSYRNSMKKYQR